MPRRIRTTSLEAAGGGKLDGYFDRVIKYIPSDIVAAYTAATGIIAGQSGPPQDQNTVRWIVFFVGLVFTAIWTWKQTSEPNLPPAKTQIVIAVVSFAVWVYALSGGPFEYWHSGDYWKPMYGSLVLIGWTLLAGLIAPKE